MDEDRMMYSVLIESSNLLLKEKRRDFSVAYNAKMGLVRLVAQKDFDCDGNYGIQLQQLQQLQVFM